MADHKIRTWKPHDVN